MKVALSTFLREINEKTTKNNQYPVLTSSKAGIFLQRDYFNKQVASRDNTGYKVIRRGQFTYRAMSDTGEFFPNMLDCTDIGIVSPAYPVFEISKPDVIIPEFLKYYFKSDVFQYSIASFAQGSTRTSIKFGKLKTVGINLPSIERQAEIIKILDKADKLIQDRTLEIQKLDDLIKARFVELYNMSVLGEETTIEAITERVKVGFVGTCEKFYTDKSGIPMLRTGNITDNGIDLSDIKYVTHEFHEKNKKSQIHEGNILIARHGSNGQANVYYGPEAQCLNAVVIVPNCEMATSVYLAGLINSPVVKTQIERTLVGSTQHVVNTKSIAGLVVRIPDLQVQREYEAFVKQVDKSKVAVQKALDEAQLLFDSLMQKYFG